MTSDQLVPVLVLLLVVALAYVGMWRGWRRRSRRHQLPPLPAPASSGDTGTLTAEGRYFGTTTAGRWLDRVVARGLGTRSPVRLALSSSGLHVERPGGSFLVPADALRGARRDRGIAGKVVPPHGVLVVTWRHGDVDLDSGFRLDPGGSAHRRTDELHAAWVRAVEDLVIQSQPSSPEPSSPEPSSKETSA